MTILKRITWILFLIFPHINAEFIFIKNPMTLRDARMACHTYGGRLAVINTYYTDADNMLSECTGKVEFWFGNFSELSTWISPEGCYELKPGNFDDKLTAVKEDSVLGCQQICGSAIGSSFGVKKGGCLCDVNTKNMMTSIDNAECGNRCDNEALCGGETVFTVYENVDILEVKDISRCSTFVCSAGILQMNIRVSYDTYQCSDPLSVVCQNEKALENSQSWSDGMRECNHTGYSHILSVKDKSICSSPSVLRNVMYWNAVFRSERSHIDYVSNSSFNEKDTSTPSIVKTLRIVDGKLYDNMYDYKLYKMFPALCEVGVIDPANLSDDVTYCSPGRVTTAWISNSTTTSTTPYTTNSTSNASMGILQSQTGIGSIIPLSAVIAGSIGGLLLTFVLVVVLVLFSLRQRRTRQTRIPMQNGTTVYSRQHSQENIVTSDEPPLYANEETSFYENTNSNMESNPGPSTSSQNVSEIYKNTDKNPSENSVADEHRTIVKVDLLTVPGACAIRDSHPYASVVKAKDDNWKEYEGGNENDMGEYDKLDRQNDQTEVTSQTNNTYAIAKPFPFQRFSDYDKLNRNRRDNVLGIYDRSNVTEDLCDS